MSLTVRENTKLVVSENIKPPVRENAKPSVRENNKLLIRVRRIRGQVEAIERALDQEAGCSDVLQLIAGARGALSGLMVEVMDDHIRRFIVDPARETDLERATATEDLIEVIRSYLK
jgi:FrmR/RcnR family transcriptional regulator, repressor of frmRAB operon